MYLRQKIWNLFLISNTSSVALWRWISFIYKRIFCCWFTRRKSLKLTEESKFFAVNNFKKVTVFSKHLKEDKKQDNVTKKLLSKDVRSDNCCTEMFFFQLANHFKTNPFRTVKNDFNCAIKNASLLHLSFKTCII